MVICQGLCYFFNELGILLMILLGMKCWNHRIAKILVT